MSQPRPGVNSPGFAAKAKATSRTQADAGDTTPRPKRQPVEVVMVPRQTRSGTSRTQERLANTPSGTTTARSQLVSTPRAPGHPHASSMAIATRTLMPSPAQARKRKASSLLDDDVDERRPFDIESWKDDLSLLYSSHDTVPLEDLALSLEALFARLPDRKAKIAASKCVTALVADIQESAEDEHAHARARERDLKLELEDAQGEVDEAQAEAEDAQAKAKEARAKFKVAQNKADTVQAEFYEAERESDIKAAKRETARDFADCLQDLAAECTAETDSDDVSNSQDSDIERQPSPSSGHEHGDAGVPYTPDDVVTVYGLAEEIGQRYNAIYMGLATDAAKPPARKLDFKVWSLSVRGTGGAFSIEQGPDSDGNPIRFGICTLNDIVEVPPHLSCSRCKILRELSGFPASKPNISQLVRPRCLYKLHTRRKDLVCLICTYFGRRGPSGQRTCGVDAVAVRQYLLDLQTRKV